MVSVAAAGIACDCCILFKSNVGTHVKGMGTELIHVLWLWLWMWRRPFCGRTNRNGKLW